jgi:hypothetical protein
MQFYLRPHSQADKGTLSELPSTQHQTELVENRGGYQNRGALQSVWQKMERLLKAL